MNNFTKLLSYSYLLMASSCLYAVHYLSQQGRGYTIQLSHSKKKLLVAGYIKQERDFPDVLYQLIQYFFHGNPLEYRGKQLSLDLSGKNLSGFDFTGCKFIRVHLKGSNLDDAILDNTTCHYQPIRRDYLINSTRYSFFERKIFRGIPKNLEDISCVYPNLVTNAQKARLLHIASALHELYIKVVKKDNNEDNQDEYITSGYYWFCALWMLKKELKEERLEEKITFSLEKTFNLSTQYACWTSRFGRPQPYISQGVTQHMSQYANQFEKGLTKWTSKGSMLKKRIRENIQNLVKIYDQIQDTKQQQQVCNIVCALSKSWQLSKAELLEWLFYWEKNLVTFKSNLAPNLKKKIAYDVFPIIP